jgi:RimJ/RimL family protein N-acetyltransferase
MLLPAFSGNGIISEAINEVMNYGFNEILALSKNY